MPDETPQTPTPEDSQPQETQAPPPEPQDAAEDDTYEDVLYEALKDIYKQFDEPDADEGGEGSDAQKPPAKNVDDMSVEELKAQLKKQGETLKAVVQASLAEREEKNAVDTWNNFLEGATQVEKDIAKTMAFEVADKAGMEEQIKQVKTTAATVEKIIASEVEKRSTQHKSSMRSQYGILTPEPEGQVDIAAQDKQDIADGNYAKVISRRFARRGES